MPLFDYFCAQNGQTVEVMLKVHESLSTWGRTVRARKGLPLGDTPADAPIEKKVSTPLVMDKASMGSGHAPVNMAYTGKSASYNT